MKGQLLFRCHEIMHVTGLYTQLGLMYVPLVVPHSYTCPDLNLFRFHIIFLFFFIFFCFQICWISWETLSIKTNVSPSKLERTIKLVFFFSDFFLCVFLIEDFNKVTFSLRLDRDIPRHALWFYLLQIFFSFSFVFFLPYLFQ